MAFLEASGESPHYLYRVYSVKFGQSNGQNSDIGFESAASRDKNCHSSLAKMEYDIAQAKLRKHLSWAIFPDDEFISWTSSLLWALQHAIRKTEKSADHELRICVLDTSRFKTGIFFSASHLIQAYGLSAFKDCNLAYHNAEYLVHGSLNVRNCSKTVSLACLREKGLFDLLPELENEYWKQRLFLRVRDLRQTLASTVIPLSQENCQKALRLARSFGDEWTMAMMMAFLALRGTLLNSEVLLPLIKTFAGKLSRNGDPFWTLTHHTSEPKRDFLDALPPYEGHYDDAPELAHFAELMNWGYAEVQKIRLRESDGLAQLNAGMNDLGLGSDGVSNATNVTEDNTSADDSSLSALQLTAMQPSRKAATTVKPLTPGGASMITVEFSGDAADGDDETEGLGNEKSLVAVV